MLSTLNNSKSSMCAYAWSQRALVVGKHVTTQRGTSVNTNIRWTQASPSTMAARKIHGNPPCNEARVKRCRVTKLVTYLETSDSCDTVNRAKHMASGSLTSYALAEMLNAPTSSYFFPTSSPALASLSLSLLRAGVPNTNAERFHDGNRMITFT